MIFSELDGYVGETLTLSTFLNKAQRYCNNIKVFEDKKILPNSLATQKGSKLNALVSAVIRDIKLTNGFEIENKKWFTKCSGTPMYFYAFTAEYAGGLVVAMGTFTLIALIVLTLETIYVHKRTKRESDVTEDNNNNNNITLNNKNVNKLMNDTSNMKLNTVSNSTELSNGFVTTIKNKTHTLPDSSFNDIKSFDNFGYDFAEEASRNSFMLY